jgi:hypothetical protein
MTALIRVKVHSSIQVLLGFENLAIKTSGIFLELRRSDDSRFSLRLSAASKSPLLLYPFGQTHGFILPRRARQVVLSMSGFSDQVISGSNVQR